MPKPVWYVSEEDSPYNPGGRWLFDARDENGDLVVSGYGQTKALALRRIRIVAAAEDARVKMMARA